MKIETESLELPKKYHMITYEVRKTDGKPFDYIRMFGSPAYLQTVCCSTDPIDIFISISTSSSSGFPDYQHSLINFWEITEAQYKEYTKPFDEK